MTDDDSELRTMLQTADPAASLPPAEPTRTARLLETTMADTVDSALTNESRADGTRHRSRLTWLVAAAAAVLIGGGVLFVLTQGDPEPAPVAGSDPAPSSKPAETVTELTVPAGGVPAKCMNPLDNPGAPDILAGNTVAFDGTVTSISGEMVTLEPSTFYAGDDTDLVVVRAPDADTAALLSAVTFEEGERYLVSATEGAVTLCGFSGAYDPALAGLYDEAFGR